MANHRSSSFRSQHLCQRLFEALEKRLGPLAYEHGENKCSIQGSGSVFAWVSSHAVNYGSINVWFLGNAGDAKGFSGLTIYKRANPSAAGWGPYGGSFNIRDERQIAEAVKLLAAASYPKSLKESK
jgi:hypothetical protein